MVFAAARMGDPVTHDTLVPAGIIGPPLSGPCPSGLVLIEGQPAAHLLCAVPCSGAVIAGVVHPPLPIPPAPPPLIVLGSIGVMIHGLPAARWLPSGDVTACGAFLGDFKLLPARRVFIGGPGIAPPSPSLTLARSLIRLEGTAGPHDGELVAQELEKLPPHVLQDMIDNDVEVVVCRGSVTEYLSHLRGVQPRGWPPGSTWDSVPGLFSPDRNEVVISTIGHGTPDGPHVPVSGEGHGSTNLVIHESMHAVDENGSGGHRSSEADFQNARNADSGNLSAYESQAGQAGREESYAESAARYYDNDPSSASNTPNLHNYWDSDPLAP